MIYGGGEAVVCFYFCFFHLLELSLIQRYHVLPSRWLVNKKSLLTLFLMQICYDLPSKWFRSSVLHIGHCLGIELCLYIQIYSTMSSKSQVHLVLHIILSFWVQQICSVPYCEVARSKCRKRRMVMTLWNTEVENGRDRTKGKILRMQVIN